MSAVGECEYVLLNLRGQSPYEDAARSAFELRPGLVRAVAPTANGNAASENASYTK